MKNRSSNTVLVRYKRRRTAAAPQTPSRPTVVRSAVIPTPAADTAGTHGQTRSPYGNSNTFRIALEQMQADMDAIRRGGKGGRRAK